VTYFEDAERRQALCELLLLPDPPDLQHRGHRTTVEGRPNRFQQLSYLTSTFIQAKLMEWGKFDFVDDVQVLTSKSRVKKA
jgi:hypothetical protein